MKKITVMLFTLLLVVFPFAVKAVSADDTKIDLSKYNTMNFREILAEEQMKEQFTNYSETDDQVTIYVFRGNGCDFCRSFLAYLNSIYNDYGKYFKVVGFEVWYDQQNHSLLPVISKFLGKEAGGVPYIIIGDQALGGYTSEYNESILSTIKTQYNAKEKYDVFEEYNKAIDAAKRAQSGNAATIITWNFIFIGIATYIIIKYIKKSNKELLEKLVESKYSNKPVKEVNKEVKVDKKKNAKKKK